VVTAGVEGVGCLGVGVGVEEAVEFGEGVGVGLVGLAAGKWDGQHEGGCLAAPEADVEMDVVGFGDCDVLEEQAGDAFAFPGGGGGIGPQSGEVGR
jgi:hypothetical protein